MTSLTSRKTDEDQHWERGRYARLARRARGYLAEQVGQHQALVAFVLRKGRVVSIGLNSYTKTHPRQAYLGRLAGQPKREYLHAELAAIIRAPDDGDTLAVFRCDKQGRFVNATPCPVCSIGIKLYNPNMKVVHT
jgi:deoxycytidylate deaminase